VAALAVSIVRGGFSVTSPPPPAVQIERLVSAGYKANRELVYHDFATDLHGFGEPSYVFVWGDPDGTRPDELEIYDNVGGRLKRELDFTAPKAAGQLVRGSAPVIDGFLGHDLVAVYSSPQLEVTRTSDDSTVLPVQVPVVVAWSDGDRRYVLSALLREAPSLNSRSVAAALARPYTLTYRARGTHSDTGYGVSSFAVTPARGKRPALLGIVDALAPASTSRYGAVTVYALKALIATAGVPRPVHLCPLALQARLIGLGAVPLRLSPNGTIVFRQPPQQRGASTTVSMGPGGVSSYDYGRCLARIAASQWANDFTCDDLTLVTVPPPRPGHRPPALHC
jgi:hypothetical protein